MGLLAAGCLRDGDQLSLTLEPCNDIVLKCVADELSRQGKEELKCEGIYRG